MKLAIAFLLGAMVTAGGFLLPRLAQHVDAHFLSARSVRNASEQPGVPAHTEETFEFVANAPMDLVAPLFGAWKEREWSPEWSPQFVWPRDAADKRGMVFTIAHGHTHAVWVNTAYDLQGGRIQYAYVIPDAMVTLITLQLTPEGNRTHVAVEYDRTALSPELNAHVQRMAEADAKAGPEWEKQVNDYLAGKMK